MKYDEKSHHIVNNWFISLSLRDKTEAVVRHVCLLYQSSDTEQEREA